MKGEATRPNPFLEWFVKREDWGRRGSLGASQWRASLSMGTVASVLPVLSRRRNWPDWILDFAMGNSSSSQIGSSFERTSTSRSGLPGSLMRTPILVWPGWKDIQGTQV